MKKDEVMVCVHTIDDPINDNFTVPSHDIRSNKPFGIHDQDSGQSSFFQKMITTTIKNKQISLAVPNEISLSLHISKKAQNEAIKNIQIINLIIKDQENIFNSDVKHAYDYLEEIQKSIVFGFKAIESFCNATIPDDYIYKKTTPKKVIEHYQKEQIERWISTSEKISEIIPEILKCNSPKKEIFWSDFKNLERIRNEIIHSKSSFQDTILSELFSDTVNDYIRSSISILEFFIKLDPTNPIFPLGFGASEIKITSVPNAEKLVSIIPKGTPT